MPTKAAVLTEQRLLEIAGEHAQRTAISWDEYLRRIRQNPAYEYTKTEWYKAGRSLEATKHLEPAPEPEPQPPPLVGGTLAQNIIFVSDTAAQALESKPHYAIAWPADHAYLAWSELVPKARAQGRKQFTWCDCRTTMPATAKRLAEQYGFGPNGWIGQAESNSEFDVAIGAGTTLLVGNANAWTQDRRTHATELINQGKLSVTQECYTNAGWPWPENTSAGGVPVHSLCIGLYDASSEQPGVGRYVPVSQYQAHCPPALWLTVCAYVSGLHPGELAQLP